MQQHVRSKALKIETALVLVFAASTLCLAAGFCLGGYMGEATAQIQCNVNPLPTQWIPRDSE